MSEMELSTIEQEIPIVRFSIDDIEFGLDVFQIRDILRLPEITRVPNCPDYVAGIINLRGAIIPVVNLRKRLGFDVITYKKNLRVLVTEYGTEVSGLLVDNVSEVMQLAAESVEPRPRYLINNIDAQYLIGLARNERMSSFNSAISDKRASKENQYILLLDLAKIIGQKTQKMNTRLMDMIEWKAKLLEEERKQLKDEYLALKDHEKISLEEAQKRVLAKRTLQGQADRDGKETDQSLLIQKVRNSASSSLSIPNLSSERMNTLPVSTSVNEIANSSESPLGSEILPKKRTVVVRKKS